VVGIIAISAKLFVPLGVSPQFLGDSVLQAVVPFGQAGLYIALFGMLFTISGAAIETCFAGAYNIAQYYEWGWGKHKKPESVPRFTALWMTIFAIATLIILTGIDPVKLTEYAVVFSVMVMPLTYLPILLTARDKKIMGKYVNGRLMSLFGWIYLVLIVLASITAVPLMILTRQGAI
jgi:manganese transport protein